MFKNEFVLQWSVTKPCFRARCTETYCCTEHIVLKLPQVMVFAVASAEQGKYYTSVGDNVRQQLLLSSILKYVLELGRMAHCKLPSIHSGSQRRSSSVVERVSQTCGRTLGLQ